ncbi:hypothetical protein IJT10_06425 [bacterium]|nr:hypothetical protein [bacterium]
MQFIQSNAISLSSKPLVASQTQQTNQESGVSGTTTSSELMGMMTGVTQKLVRSKNKGKTSSTASKLSVTPNFLSAVMGSSIEEVMTPANQEVQESWMDELGANSSISSPQNVESQKMQEIFFQGEGNYNDSRLDVPTPGLGSEELKSFME